MKQTIRWMTLGMTLTVGVWGCHTDQRTSAASSGIAVEDGNGRGPASLKIQFNSIGSGIDNVAKTAVDRFLAYERQQGRVSNIQTRNWGREGEINYCIDFEDNLAAFDAVPTLSRIAWIATHNDKPVQLQVIWRCNEDELQPFTGSHVAPFNQSGEDQLTLVCSYSDDEGQYFATVEVRESVVGAAGDEIGVALRWLQAGPNARFAPVEDQAESFTTRIENTRSFVIAYQGDTLSLEFWPTFLEVGYDYRARLLTASGQTVVTMTCRN